MNIFLDLEGTIINNWNEGLLINPQKIKNFIHSTANVYNRSVTIFSFAIYDENDREEFVTSGMKEAIENSIDCMITNVLNVKEIQKAVYEYEKVKYDSIFEFIQMNGKQWSFIKYCMIKHVGETSILIDDCVGSIDIIDRKQGTEIILHNIKYIS